MDALEQYSNDAIRDSVTDRLKGLSDSFSILTVGHITKFIEPINCSIGIAEALERLASMQDALHPAVLRLIRIAVQGAASSGTPVAVCGEVAGDPAGALILVGLGVDDLSVEPGAIGPVRAALAGVTLSDLRALAGAALRVTDAAAVRALAAELLPGRGAPA